MNISAIKNDIYRALSAKRSSHGGALDKIAEECIDEILASRAFVFTHAFYTSPLPFLEEEPYRGFLSEAEGYFLISATLGHELDLKIRRLGMSDPSRMTVLDAAAGAVLEALAHERTQELGRELSVKTARDDIELSYIFCPGYGGTRVTDSRYILDELAPLGHGITVTDRGLLMPQKSMVGICAVKSGARPSCGGCARFTECSYRKEGKLCFHSEKLS